MPLVLFPGTFETSHCMAARMHVLSVCGATGKAHYVETVVTLQSLFMEYLKDMHLSFLKAQNQHQQEKINYHTG